MTSKRGLAVPLESEEEAEVAVEVDVEALLAWTDEKKATERMMKRWNMEYETEKVND
jgi:hypothetical protein